MNQKKIALLLPLGKSSLEVWKNVKACKKLSEHGYEVHLFGRYQKLSRLNYHQIGDYDDDCWQKISVMKFDFILNHAGAKILLSKNLFLPPIATVIYDGFNAGQNLVAHLDSIVEPVISIKSSQRNKLPALRYIGNVNDDFSIEDYKYMENNSEYLVWCEPDGDEQGYSLAKKVAFESRFRLEIIDATHNHLQRNEILGNAFGLLVTSKQRSTQIPIASLATGTPILAIKGCLPEGIITPETGVFVSCGRSENKPLTITYNIGRLTLLNRQDCRNHAEKLISDNMVKNYAKICNLMIKSNKVSHKEEAHA